MLNEVYTMGNIENKTAIIFFWWQYIWIGRQFPSNSAAQRLNFPEDIWDFMNQIPFCCPLSLPYIHKFDEQRVYLLESASLVSHDP